LDAFRKLRVEIAIASRRDRSSEKLRARRVTALSLDLLPRIARAQSMDVPLDGEHRRYKGVLLGEALGKFFPC